MAKIFINAYKVKYYFDKSPKLIGKSIKQYLYHFIRKSLFEGKEVVSSNLFLFIILKCISNGDSKKASAEVCIVNYIEYWFPIE